MEAVSTSTDEGVAVLSALGKSGEGAEMFGILQSGANDGASIFFHSYYSTLKQYLLDLLHL
jgi:hypothetical protein